MASPKFPTAAVTTNKDRANQFIHINMVGWEDWVDELRAIYDSLDPRVLKNLMRRAAVPVRDGYKNAVKPHDQTGNLAASTTIKVKAYDRATVAIAGPENTGTQGASADRPSGNHAWLVEFGSDRRKPGTQGRRTYINTHKSINNRMQSHRVMDEGTFASQSRGVYFLMGSKNEPTRQARMGKGYSHDFMVGEDGEMHPMTLGPGDTYGAMPALGLMANVIAAQTSRSQEIIAEGIEKIIASRGGTP